MYNKKKKTESSKHIHTAINELKSDYKKQYLLIKEWLDAHDINFDPDVVYTLSTIDNRLYEYERIVQQIDKYNIQYKQAGISEYIRNIYSFIAGFDNYVPQELADIISDDKK